MYERPMTFPTLLLALLVALLYGALFHLVRGGGFWRLVLYLLLSAFGFALGYWVGLWRGWVLFPLGSLNLGMCSLGSVVTLLIGDWLSRLEVERESKV